ncbi:MAG TPA: cyclodeaminase/cyclohydrolase family protein [Mucilaginibacter sp.]|jgi:formiminotetrahydrofolate cyclodeaminase|nr:cyclodeaminase/cyclohydrolase family protein [Mucilaginibacter sp.]
MNENENEQQQIEFLELPTKKLLEKFGEGKHIPGSGSAVALSGLLASELIKTVCKLTKRKPEYYNVHTELDYIQVQIETIYQPRFFELFNRDIAVFDEVSRLRQLRDLATDLNERRRLSRQATERLKEATEIPLEICRICLQLSPLAFSIFDTGFKSARGDSGVAISNLLSAMSGSLFIAFLNLKTGNSSKWVKDLREEAEKLASQYGKTHKEAIRRITMLYSEGLAEDSIQTKLDLE